MAEDLQTVINAIREFKSSESIQVLTDYASALKREGEYIKECANGIQSDVTTDKSALDLVKDANIKLQALLDAADNQVELAKRAILTGDKMSGSYVEQNIVDVKSAIFAIVDATKASAELAVDKVKRPIAGLEKAIINVPDKPEPTTTATIKEVKPEEKTETKTDSKEDKLEQTSKTSDANEGEHVKAEGRIESTVDVKEAGASKPENELSEIKSDTKISSNENLEPKAHAQKADAEDQDVKLELDEPKKVDLPKSKESPVTNDGAKNNNEAPKEANIDIKREMESKNSIGAETVPEKQRSESAAQHSDGQTAASGGDPANSNSPLTTDISHTETTLLHGERPLIESHSDAATDIHMIAKSMSSGSTASTPVDLGDLHASSSEVGSELTSAATSAAEFVHDLANVVATSLFF